MTFRLIFLIFVLIQSLLFAQEPTSKTQAQLYYEQGLHTADLSEKINLFEKALRINPVHQPALYRLGITYYRMGNYLKTVETLSKVHEIEDSQKETLQLYLRNTYALLAKDLIKQEKYEPAQSAARDALDIAPDYSAALTALGTAQFYMGNYRDAIESLSRSVILDSLQYQAWNRLGDIYLRIENYPDAIFAYQSAVALNPNLTEAKFHLDIAQKRCTPDFLLQKAGTALAQDNREEAVYILEQGKILYPHNAELAAELTRLQHEDLYEQSLDAIDGENWEQALAMLSKLPEDYKNTALMLEEVNAKLSPPQPDDSSGETKVVVSNAKTAPKKREAVDIAAPKKEPVEITETADSPPAPAPETVVTKLPADTTEFPVIQDSQQLASTDMIIVPVDSLKTTQAEPKDFYSDTPLQLPEKIPQNEDSSAGFWYGLFIGVGVMAVLAFLLIRNRAYLRQQKQLLVQKFAGLKTGTRTKDLMQIASETPVKYGSIATSDLLEQTDSKADAGHPDENLLHLMETKTIAGGIHKLQRIGRYVIEQEVGRGSMGLVYKAWDPKLERTVVIKQVMFNKEEYIELSRLHDRLLREARAAGKLNHPNIVVIYDVEEDRNFSYIVMEYVEGYNLKLVLEKQINLNAERAINITRQICQALAFAHENEIIHRDIKPSNIILTKKDVVKVADFGIAKLPQFETLTQTDDIVGTPYYMSPEQIEGRKVDGRSDVFSTGVVLYEMLTGNRPFQGDNIPSIVYKIVHKIPKAPSHRYDFIPKHFDAVIKKALAKEPAQRYQSAREFAEALDVVSESIRK